MLAETEDLDVRREAGYEAGNLGWVGVRRPVRMRPAFVPHSPLCGFTVKYRAARRMNKGTADSPSSAFLSSLGFPASLAATHPESHHVPPA